MRLGEGVRPPSPPPGVRVVLDVRALQQPDRAPVTAAYLRRLLGAYAAEPLAGESFFVLLDVRGDDPTAAFEGLPVAGRRRLPTTRLFRSGALTLDPFFLRGAAIGSGFRARRQGATGVVAHAVGGALPIGPGLLRVATLLDLAAWELPGRYQGSAAARFGQRLRAQLLRDAAAVLVGSEAVAAAARRLLHLRPERIRVVALAGDDRFRPLPGPEAAGGPAARAALAAERDRLGLPERYFVYTGRYDARQDVGTLLGALARLSGVGRPAGLDPDVPWPPRAVLVGANPEDRAAVGRAAALAGVGDLLGYAPGSDEERIALLVAGARAAVLPVRHDAAGLPALDALAAGTPVVASAVGPLPEIVGAAGILVEPGDPDRLATALRAAWCEDPVHAAIAAAAAGRAADRRTWADVARDTRRVYAEVTARPGAAA